MTKPTPNRYQVTDYKSPIDTRRMALLRDGIVGDNLTVLFEDEARNLVAQLTAWLDAPRLAARETAEVVARDSIELQRWRDDGKAPSGSCPFCASRISMIERDGRFCARCSHPRCGATGPLMTSITRAADLFCCPPVALRNAAPAIAAAVEELTAARAEIAALNRQVCRLVSGQEIDGDRLCQHHGADVAALALLSDERAAHAETSRDLDALLTALGAQVTPGGQTEAACHARRVADGMRLARELVAAREVPADVEAAIRALVDGVHFCALEIDDPKAAEGSPGFPGWPDMGSPMIANLRTAIAAEIERARAEGRAESPAAPATVGGLLGSFPIVEWRNGDDWFQARIAQLADGRIRGASLRWRHVNASAWSTWGQPWGAWEHMTVPARIVLDASEADADPASRGPIGASSPPNPHPDGCHTTDTTAPRDCASDGHHECSSCTRKIGGGS